MSLTLTLGGWAMGLLPAMLRFAEAAGVRAGLGHVGVGGLCLAVGRLVVLLQPELPARPRPLGHGDVVLEGVGGEAQVAALGEQSGVGAGRDEGR